MLPRQVITAIFVALVSQGLVVAALPQPEPSNKTGSERLNDRSSNEVNGLKVLRADLKQSHSEDRGTHVARAQIVGRASTSEIVGYASAGVTIVGVGGHYIHVAYKKLKKNAKKRRNQATREQWIQLTTHVANELGINQEDVEAQVPIRDVIADSTDDESGGVPLDGSSAHGTTGTSGSSGGVTL